MRFAYILTLALFFSDSGILAAKKPNIVYIMCDELGYYETSFMGSRQSRLPTLISWLLREFGLPKHSQVHRSAPQLGVC